MPFTISDYRDLLRLLEEHSDWRDELRRALLSDDFLASPRLAQERIQGQDHTDEHLAALAEAQRHANGVERWTTGAKPAAGKAHAAPIFDGRPSLFWGEAVQAWTAQEG